MSETKLKPCPFCGSTKISKADCNRYFYCCEDCEACGPRALKKNDIDSWNMRANEYEERDMIEHRVNTHLAQIGSIFRQEEKKLKAKIVMEYISDVILTGDFDRDDMELAIKIMSECFR